MSSTGMKPDDIILQETITRLNDYKVSIKAMIDVNNQLIEVIYAKAEADKADLKTLDKLAAKEKILLKERAKLQRVIRKEAKLNSQITKRNNRNQLDYKKTLKEVNTEIKRNTSLLKANNRVAKKSGGFFNKIGRSLKSAFTPNLLGIGAAVAGVASLADNIKQTIHLLKKLDSIELAMKTALYGDSKALERSMGNMYNMSRQYGVNLIDITERYNKFLVASQQSNISLRDTEEIFETVIKASAVMGLSNEELKGSLLALEQMMSKGKITTEELRRQLGERMPGAMGIMADAMGVDIKVLDKMMKKGEVLTRDVLPAFAEAMKKAYHLDEISGNIETLIATEQRATTAWTRFIQSMEDGNGVLSNFLKGWNNLKTSVFDWLYSWSEKLEGEKWFARGVNAAKQYVKGLVSVQVKNIEKASGKELAPMEKLKIKKDIELEKAPDEIKKLEKLEERANEYVKRLNKIYKISDDAYAKYKAKALTQGVTAFGAIKYLQTLITGGDQEENKKNIKLYRSAFEQWKKIQGQLNYWKGIVKDYKKIEKDLEDETNKLKKSAHAKSFNQPTTKIFNDKWKSLREILVKLKAFYKEKYKLTNSHKERLEFIEEEYKIDLKIAKIDKERAELKLEASRDKELESIEKQKTKLKETYAWNIKKRKELIDALNPTSDGYAEKLAIINKEFNNAGYKKALDTLKQNEKVVKEKYEYELNYVQTVFNLSLNKIERERVQASLKSLEKEYRDKIEANRRLSKIEMNEELKDLNKKYRTREITEEQYQKRLADLKLKYNRKSIEEEIKLYEELKRIALGTHKETTPLGDLVDVPNSTIADIQKIIAKIKELKAELEKGRDNWWLEDVDEFIQKYKDAFLSMTDAIADYIDASYQHDIDLLDRRLDKIKEFYDKQYEMAEGDAERRKVIREEEAAQEKKLQDEKKKLLREQAIARKKYAKFTTFIDTMSAIIHFLVDPGGLPGVGLSIMAGIEGAAKLAAINKESIPEFKHGVRRFRGGPAIVGDGGVKEIIESKHGVFETPNRPTLVYLTKGANVYKNKQEYVEKVLNDTDSKNNASFINENSLSRSIFKGLNQLSFAPNVSVLVDDFNAYKSNKIAQ